ncbi:MAG: hypothetical protein HOY79_44955 [Streptomyces sp.]|nr:hypothetical protein [Streptomyces sp.]
MEASVIICDYAQVNNGKLYITGGAVNLIATALAEAPHPIDAYAAITIAVPWNAHNQMHRLAVTLVDDDGATIPLGASPPETPAEDQGKVVGQFNIGRPAIMEYSDESLFPLAIPLRTAVPALGGYRLKVEVDGTDIGSARFRVVHSPQIQFQAR